MTDAMNWEYGYAAGTYAYYSCTPRELKQYLVDVRYYTPYCKGARAAIEEIRKERSS